MTCALLFTCLGFLSGSILFSYHIPLWFRHVDIVQASCDHNPGAANAVRCAGVPLGLVCVALDIAKGCWPVFAASRILGVDTPLMCPVMLAPVLGHALGLAYRFRGGKAIAVTFGVLAGLLPLSRVVFVLAFWYVVFSVVIVVRPNEKRSVAAFGCFAASCLLLVLLRTHRWWLALGCLAVACVPAYKNWADIRRDPLPNAQPVPQKR